MARSGIQTLIDQVNKTGQIQSDQNHFQSVVLRNIQRTVQNLNKIMFLVGATATVNSLHSKRSVPSIGSISNVQIPQLPPKQRIGRSTFQEFRSDLASKISSRDLGGFAKTLLFGKMAAPVSDLFRKKLKRNLEPTNSTPVSYSNSNDSGPNLDGLKESLSKLVEFSDVIRTKITTMSYDTTSMTVDISAIRSSIDTISNGLSVDEETKIESGIHQKDLMKVQSDSLDKLISIDSKIGGLSTKSGGSGLGLLGSIGGVIGGLLSQLKDFGMGIKNIGGELLGGLEKSLIANNFGKGFLGVIGGVVGGELTKSGVGYLLDEMFPTSVFDAMKNSLKDITSTFSGMAVAFATGGPVGAVFYGLIEIAKDFKQAYDSITGIFSAWRTESDALKLGGKALDKAALIVDQVNPNRKAELEAEKNINKMAKMDYTWYGGRNEHMTMEIHREFQNAHSKTGVSWEKFKKNKLDELQVIKNNAKKIADEKDALKLESVNDSIEEKDITFKDLSPSESRMKSIQLNKQSVEASKQQPIVNTIVAPSSNNNTEVNTANTIVSSSPSPIDRGPSQSMKRDLRF